MPVYVYRNLVTNETFEYQQRITEDALSLDPRTGDPVRRVIQPVGIAFKGSGFYVNDSRQSGGASAPSGDKPSAGPESTAAVSTASDASSQATAGGAEKSSATTPATTPASAG